ncbi:MAG: cold shock domain-containing protein [Candidatus Binataceae bacterium]
MKLLDSVKGYGYIAVDRGQEIIFHANQTHGQAVNAGDRVAFELEMGTTGLNAENLWLVRGVPVAASSSHGSAPEQSMPPSPSGRNPNANPNTNRR